MTLHEELQLLSTFLHKFDIEPSIKASRSLYTILDQFPPLTHIYPVHLNRSTYISIDGILYEDVISIQTFHSHVLTALTSKPCHMPPPL